MPMIIWEVHKGRSGANGRRVSQELLQQSMLGGSMSTPKKKQTRKYIYNQEGTNSLANLNQLINIDTQSEENALRIHIY
jgi:hypothetical protein